MAADPASTIGSLVILFGVSASLVYAFHRLGLPPLLAYLFSGILLNPTFLGVVKGAHIIHVLSELGVIFLLFSIGLEFSFERLKEISSLLLKAGLPQVVLTVIVTALVSYGLFHHGSQAVFFGLLVALSSTAIVFKILSDRGELFSPHGKLAVAILLFQDLCVVPFMLFVPLLGKNEIALRPVALALLETAGLILALWMIAEKLLPKLLHHILKTRNRELFVITIILVVLGVPLVSYKLGLSFSLGAFLAGLIISRSEYAHQVFSEILPLRDTLIGFFFISIGLLIDAEFLRQNIPNILASALFVSGIKFLVIASIGYLMSRSFRIGIQTGLYLSQIGEFSFVLALSGREYQLLPPDFYQIFLTSAIITMLLTPFFIKFLGPRLYGIPSTKTKDLVDESRASCAGHVILVGFGVVGRNLAKALKEAKIPYVIVELNAETVKRMKREGEPIYFGDASSKVVLEHMCVDEARMLVVAVSDPMAARRIVAIARRENPRLYILVRTRFLGEVPELKALGADEVVPEEFVSSLEILESVLKKYSVPSELIESVKEKIRHSVT